MSARAALAGLQSELGPAAVVYADYHILTPLNSPATVARGQDYSVSATPTVFFDGGNRIVGSNPPPEPRYREAIEQSLADSASISLRVSAQTAGAGGSLRISVDYEIAEGETIESPSGCRVRALLFEDNVASQLGTFHHVVRDVPLDAVLQAGGSGETGSASIDAELNPAWKLEDLYVVAWIQRGERDEILNAAQTQVDGANPVERLSWGAIKHRFGR